MGRDVNKRYGYLLVMLYLCSFLIACSDVSNQAVNHNAQQVVVTDLGYQSQFIHVNGINLHYVQAGEGEIVLFLHGFPFFGESWHPLLKPMSKNFNVVAPDLRGYGLSEKPNEVTEYKIERLVEDVNALIEELSPSKPVKIVSHDWGGAVAFGLAQVYPEKISQLVVINAPPFNVYIKTLAESDSQREASRYIHELYGWTAKIYFAIKGPELIWKSYEPLHQEGILDDQYKHMFFRYWEQKGAARGATSWYEANIPKFNKIDEQSYWPSKTARIKTETLLVWSKFDRSFTLDTFYATIEHADALTTVELDTDSHAPFIDQSEVVRQLIMDFFN